MSKPPEDENARVKDYFGTFLESVKRASPEYPDEASGAASSASGGEPAAIGGLAVLTVLAPAQGPMPLSDLMSQLGVSVLQVGSVLTPLVDSGLIEVTGAPGAEMVALTQDGTKLTRAAT